MAHSQAWIPCPLPLPSWIMATDPDEQVPSDPLPEVPLDELIDRLRDLVDEERLDARRGQFVVALRARDLSWRKIEAMTGIPQGSARRWAQRYLERRQ